MKAAFTFWENRIAPVFDTAHQLHVIHVDAGQVLDEKKETLAEDLPVQKALHLVALGIGTLVCGAISRPLYDVISAYGIRVVPFVAGDLKDVVQAWLDGSLNRDIFAMPGCTGRNRRRFGGIQDHPEEPVVMNGKGGGRGAGAGRGRGARRRSCKGPLEKENLINRNSES